MARTFSSLYKCAQASAYWTHLELSIPSLISYKTYVHLDRIFYTCSFHLHFSTYSSWISSWLPLLPLYSCAFQSFLCHGNHGKLLHSFGTLRTIIKVTLTSPDHARNVRGLFFSSPAIIHGSPAYLGIPGGKLWSTETAPAKDTSDITGKRKSASLSLLVP